MANLIKSDVLASDVPQNIDFSLIIIRGVKFGDLIILFVQKYKNGDTSIDWEKFIGEYDPTSLKLLQISDVDVNDLLNEYATPTIIEVSKAYNNKFNSGKNIGMKGGNPLFIIIMIMLACLLFSASATARPEVNREIKCVAGWFTDTCETQAQYDNRISDEEYELKRFDKGVEHKDEMELTKEKTKKSLADKEKALADVKKMEVANQHYLDNIVSDRDKANASNQKTMYMMGVGMFVVIAWLVNKMFSYMSETTNQRLADANQRVADAHQRNAENISTMATFGEYQTRLALTEERLYNSNNNVRFLLQGRQPGHLELQNEPLNNPYMGLGYNPQYSALVRRGGAYRKNKQTKKNKQKKTKRQ